MKPKDVVKVGDVMVTISLVVCAVVLAMFSALWLRMTRRDLETTRMRALHAHLDWRPVPKTKPKRRTTLRR